ncbi:hypothetical protein NKG94_36160 [Micromonospora sp. M12]
MTTEGFREVDDDLLADYLGGALDGTPQHEEVARLVSADPAWAEAYALLAPAVTKVREGLARWAEPSPEMPQAIADRLLASLAAASSTNDTSTGLDSDEDTAAPLVVPVQGGPVAGRPYPTSRIGRWAPTGQPPPAWLGPPQRSGGRRHDRRSRCRTRPQPAVDADVGRLRRPRPEQPGHRDRGRCGAGAVRTTGPALRSGTNYTPQTVDDVYRTEASGAPVPAGRPATRPAPNPRWMPRRATSSPDGLDQLARLTDEVALSSCLATVAAEHGSGPLVVEVIDYARFQGEQTLVIRFTDSTGARWAWVSGPECGVPGSGSDSRYSARVG